MNARLVDGHSAKPATAQAANKTPRTQTELLGIDPLHVDRHCGRDPAILRRESMKDGRSNFSDLNATKESRIAFCRRVSDLHLFLVEELMCSAVTALSTCRSTQRINASATAKHDERIVGQVTQETGQRFFTPFIPWP